VIAADLCQYRGDGTADLVICMATLEHVPDAAGAIRAIASCLRPGGRACLFMPSRNAVFARLNLILPQRLKERLLFNLIPEKAAGHDGFPAFYNACTPRQMIDLARSAGLEPETRELYWISSYFMILTPVFVIWRVWQGLFWLIARDQAAETFALVLRKPTSATHG
jgi:SAM-dependent methyltransferase